MASQVPQRPDADSVLEQSLLKPGLAETLLYWRLCRPLSETPSPQSSMRQSLLERLGTIDRLHAVSILTLRACSADAFGLCALSSLRSVFC